MKRIFTLLISLLFGSSIAFAQTQASGINFQSGGNNNTSSIRINWTSGASTAGRIVIIKNSLGTFSPTNGTNISTLGANSNFSSATDLDPSVSGVAKAVYAAAGAGSNVVITNLVSGTQYYVQIYEFTGSGVTPTYLVSTNSTNPLGVVFYTSNGTFTVPADVTLVVAQAWGGGGGGGEGPSGNSGPGGGGGAYATGTAAVSFGVNPTITVGTGGGAGDDNDPGSSGGPSSFGSDVIALGGTQNNNVANGSPGGSGAGSTGNIITYSGGNGGNGNSAASLGGGGGGSSATPTGVGVNGSNHAGGTGGAGGDGNDGDGGKGGDNGVSNAVAGTFPGGGGGGRGDGGGTGGVGAGGLVIVSYNDNTAPTAAITREDTNPTNATGVTFRVTFNEDVSNVNLADFEIAGGGGAGLLTGFTIITPNRVFDIDATSVSGNGALNLDFVGGQNIVDLSNNAFGGTPSSEEVYTIDTTAPTVVLNDDHADAIVRDADNVVITAVFTEANGLGGTPTISIAGLTAPIANVNMTATGDPLVWTYTWNVPAGDNGAHAVSIAAADAASNANAAATAGTGPTSYTIDNTAPTVVLNDDHADAIVGNVDNVVITAVFTEANGLGGTPTISIAGLTAPIANVNMTATGDPLVWTYTWDVPAGDDGAHAVSVAVTDVAGNANAAATAGTGPTSYTIDNTGPSVVLNDDHADAIVGDADNIVITAVFTEVSGLGGTPTISIAGLTAPISNVNMTATGDPLVWTYTWNVPVGDEGAHAVSIAATDAFGNSNSAATAGTGPTSYTIDNTAPTVVLNDDHADAIVRDADNVVITAVFTEVNGLSGTPTISIAGLTAPISNVNMTATGDPLVWTYTWDVPAGDNGAHAVSIAAVDAASNANAAATTGTGPTSYTIDNTAPTVVLNDDHADAIVGNADNVVITAVFTEANGLGGTPTISIAGLTAPISNVNMTATGDPLVWTYTWNVPAVDQGAHAVSVAVTDVAGNANTAATAGTGPTSYTIDHTAPTVVLNDDHADAIVRDADNVVITAVFTEANGLGGTPTISIAGLTAPISNVNMTATGDPLIWTYTWNVPAGDDGAHAVSITAIDAAGNTNASATAGTGPTSYTIDNTAPVIVSVTSDATGVGTLKIGDQIIFTVDIQTTEAGLTISPTTYNGGTLTWSAVSGGDSYTATYTVTSGHSDQTSALQLLDVTATDGIGNESAEFDGSDVLKLIDANNPPAFTTGTLTTVTAPIVTGFWNASNTGIDVNVPIPANVMGQFSLVGGTVQIQGRVGADAFVNIGSASAIVLGGEPGTTKVINLAAAQFESIANFANGQTAQLRAVITDVAGNTTTGGTSATNIFIDETSPTVLTVGSLTATGGRVVTGYYNSTNTGFDVTVPLTNTDATLDNGTIQIQVQNTSTTGYINVPSTGLVTITNTDRTNGTKTISISATNLEAAVVGLQGFSEGAVGNAFGAETKFLQARAIVTDAAGNTTSFNQSATSIDVDQTPISVITPFGLYFNKGIQNGNREVLLFRLSEDLYDHSGSVRGDNHMLQNTDNAYGNSGISVGDPGGGGNDIPTNYVRYEDDGGANAADNTIFNTRLLWVESNNNSSNWSSSASPVTRMRYVQLGTGSSAGNVIRDAAGNELGAFATAVSSGDIVPPTLSPNTMTLSPRAGNPEKIVFTLSEVLSTPTTANGVTGFSTSTGAVGDATYTEASPGVCPCTITLTSAFSGDWTSSTTVSYDQGTGNVLDLATPGNELATITNHAVVVETVAPVITAVSIPNAAMNVGSIVTVTITTQNDDGDDPAFFGTPTVGGFTLSGLTSVNATTKTATFTVTEGGTNVAAGSTIPVSIRFVDGQSNQSTTFTTAISQANDPIDATSPTISSITNSESIIFEGGANLIQTVTVVYSETMNTAVQPTITLVGGGTNWGVQTPSGGTNGWVGNTYTATFTHNGTQETITGITSSVAVGGAQDAAGNPNLGTLASSVFIIDTQKPLIGSITRNLTAVTVANNTIRITVRYNESMSTASAPTINFSAGSFAAGVPVTGGGYTNGWTTTSLTNDTYQIDFTSSATETVSPAAASANGAVDANGNVQTTSVATANFVIDTERPTLLSINRQTPAAGLTNSNFLTFRATFSENVNNGSVNVTDFTPVLSGVTFVTAVAPVAVGGSSGTQFDITFTGVSGNGTFGLDLAGSPTISDIRGNSLSTTTLTGEVYTIDQTPPNATAIDISSPVVSFRPDLNGRSATSISFLVTFDDDVTNVDATDFTVNAGTSVSYNAALDVSGSGDTRTVTINDVLLLNFNGDGQIKINLVNDGTILDDAGNALNTIPTTTFSGNDFYTIFFPEPVDAPLNFSVAAQTTTSITLGFDQPAFAPTNPVHGYWIQYKKSTDSFTALTDGVFDFSVTPFVFPTQPSMIKLIPTLISGFDYDFRIISTSYSGDYGPQPVLDYFTATPLTGSSFTTVGSDGTFSAGTPITSISSTITTSTGAPVFNFALNEDGATPSADNAPTKFNQIVIKRGGTNTVLDWSTTIAGAMLVDEDANVLEDGVNGVTVTVNADEIIFSGIASSQASDFGFVEDDEIKTFSLRIWLANPLVVVDNSKLDFRIDDTSITYNNNFDLANNSQRSSQLLTGTFAESGAININVYATQLVFTQNPQAQIGVGTSFATATGTSDPAIQAQDANGNLDTDYNATFSITSSLGYSTTHTNFVAGVLTLSNFHFTTTGSTTIGISGNATGIPFNYPVLNGGAAATSSSITAVLTTTTTITSAAGGEPATISSLTSALTGAVVPQVNAVSNFNFTVTDDAVANTSTFEDNDALPTLINSITITQSGDNDPDLVDWTKAIAGAELTLTVRNGVPLGVPVAVTTQANVSIGAASITFTNIPFNLAGSPGRITDGGSNVYTLKIFLKNPVDPSIADLIDNKDFVFRIATTGLDIAGATDASSTLTPSNTESGDGNNQVDVDATRLLFTTQWAVNANQNYDAPLSPSPAVAKAQDVNGNLDIDYNTAATVTASGTAPATYPLVNDGVTVLNGILTFDTDLQVSSTGNGLNGNSASLTLASGGLTNGTSNAFILNYSGDSDIIKDAGFTYTEDILYAEPDNQVATITASTGTEVERFTVQDGGGTPDSDGSATRLSSITIRVTNYHYLRSVALYNEDSGDKVAELAVTVGNYSIVSPGVADFTFSGIPTTGPGSFEAPDNGDNNLTVKVSFINGTVLDNDVLAFQVMNVVAGGVSSAFANENPAGIVSTASGDENKLEVVATQLDFTTPATSPVTASLSTPFAVVVEARDANANLDLDFTAGSSTVTALSNASGATMTSTPTIVGSNFTDGVLNFPGDFQFTTGDNNDDVTLSITAGGISSIAPPAPTTPEIILSSSFESVLIVDPLFTPILDIPYINNQNINTAGSSFALAQFELIDGNGTTNDLDGADTNIDDITFSITNPENVRSLGIYVGTTLIQAKNNAAFVTAGTTTVTFDNLFGSLLAPDNGSLVFTVRASFFDDAAEITDNEVIQLHVTNVTQNGGSQFNNIVPSPVGGITGGAISDPNVRIEVTATRLDFTTQPSAIEGINQPLSIEPVVQARDINEVVDLDFNFTATIASGVLVNPPALNFVNGVLNFTGVQYLEAGVGTYTVSANGLSSNTGGSEPSNTVDVIHVRGILNEKGIVSSFNLKGGTSNAVIFGVSLIAEHKAASDPGLQKFSIVFDKPYQTSSTTVLKNFRFFETRSSQYTTSGADAVVPLSSIAGATVIREQSPLKAIDPLVPSTALDMVTVAFATPRQFTTDTLTYYMMVDVDATANINTPSLTPMLVDNGYKIPSPLLEPTDTLILITKGSAAADSLRRRVSGQVRPYTFASTKPPTLVSSYPKNGQINVDSTQSNVLLIFDVAVWSIDKKIELWDRYGDTKIADLIAQNGRFFGLGNPSTQPANDTLIFSIPPSVKLFPDSVYYIKIAQGTLTNQNTDIGGAGISDDGFNLYGGLSYNGGLYFKIASKVPPVMSATNPDKYYLSKTGGAINATFDQFGKAYFLVVNGGGTTAASAPSIAAIKAGGTGYVGGIVVGSGSIDIKQIGQPQFGSFTSINPAGLTENATYNVWMYAENDALPNSIATTSAYGSKVNQFAVGSNGPTFQITIPASGAGLYTKAPIYQICANSNTQLADPIVIAETATGQFGTGLQNFNILMPTGFQFVVDSLPTIKLSGADFDQSKLSFSFLNNTILRVNFETTSTLSLDQIVISDLYVLATASDLNGDIIRFAGNAFPALLPDEAVLAKLVSSTAVPFSFTNSYTLQNSEEFEALDITNTVTYIPDNFIDDATNAATTRLLPLLNKKDYGPSFFSGSGVTNDVLSLSGVTLNTAFNITMTHTDMNGCVSNEVVQYTVYDHTKAIASLGTEECITNDLFPNGLSSEIFSDTILYQDLAGFNLISLTATIPSKAEQYFEAPNQSNNTENSQIIFGTDWESLVNQIPQRIGSLSTTSYGSYWWNYQFLLNAETIGLKNPYHYFQETTPQNQTYYKGGSLGLVEFTGKYESTADTDVKIPFRQEVEIFVPAVPVVEVNTSNQSAVDAGIPIFCERGGDIIINGYPAASTGSSTGRFELFQEDGITSISYDVDAFIDNGNGTATLKPHLIEGLTNVGITNGYSNVLIRYTYKDNNSPCESSGDLIIRVTPNPTANFTARSILGFNTPLEAAYCTEKSIVFDASDESSIAPGFSIANYAWNFDDDNAASGNLNVLSGADADSVQHYFVEASSYTVTLVTTSQFGCLSPLKDSVITVGGVPLVKFSFTGVSTADNISFDATESEVSANDNIQSINWIFGDSKPGASGVTTSHQYDSAKNYTVISTLTSSIGCVNSDTSLLVIVNRFIPLSSSDQYLQDFELINKDSWQSFSTGSALSSWDTLRLNATPTTGLNSRSGRIWKTTKNGGKTYASERSAVYTSSFDMRQWSRPILIFDSYFDLSNSDGVVIEYSTDNLNVVDPLKDWILVGETGSGVEWYNQQNLSGKPGDQENNFYGWSGNSDGWKTSRHSLADVLNEENVVFRFTLGSVSDPTDGFAIDNVRIGNGTRTVLIENFTNTSSTDPNVVDENEFIADEFAENSVGVEVIKTNYHTAFPGIDPFNTLNPDDPGSRALYYGISSVPDTRLDGFTQKTVLNPLFSQWGSGAFNSRVLDLADIVIDSVGIDDSNPEADSIYIEFTPGLDLTNSTTILHVIVLEEEVLTSLNSGLGPFATNETRFEYVVRKMLPTAAGTKFLSLNQGQTYSLSIPWTEGSAFAPANDMAIVVFLQDELTKTVYQAHILDDIDDPKVITAVEESADKSFDVYPNPADQEMIVKLPKAASKASSLQVLDQMGKVVSEMRFEKGEQTKQIVTDRLTGGMYLIRIETAEGMLMRKVMVVHRQ